MSVPSTWPSSLIYITSSASVGVIRSCNDPRWETNPCLWPPGLSSAETQADLLTSPSATPSLSSTQVVAELFRHCPWGVQSLSYSTPTPFLEMATHLHFVKIFLSSNPLSKATSPRSHYQSVPLTCFFSPQLTQPCVSTKLDPGFCSRFLFPTGDYA